MSENELWQDSYELEAYEDASVFAFAPAFIDYKTRWVALEEVGVELVPTQIEEAIQATQEMPSPGVPRLNVIFTGSGKATVYGGGYGKLTRVFKETEASRRVQRSLRDLAPSPLAEHQLAALDRVLGRSRGESESLPSQPSRPEVSARLAARSAHFSRPAPVVSIARAEQLVWFFIVFIGIVWGIFTGLSLGQSISWLPPAVGLFGCGSILALGLTVKAFRRDLARLTA